MATHSHRHAVQIYETDAYLSQRVVELVTGAWVAQQRCVLVATAAHRQLFVDDLAAAGHDVAAAQQRGDLVLLDAHETLARFMLADRPDAGRFREVVGGVIESAGRGGQEVCAFGEMVDVLWQQGNVNAALELEKLWTELARAHHFRLLCAYTIASVFRTAPGRFDEICQLHDHTHDAEHIADDNVRLLIVEIARRVNVERELRESVRELQRVAEGERIRTARVQKLQQATAALAGAVSIGELTDTIITTAEQALGAVAATIYLVDGDGRYRLSASRGVPNAARWTVLPLDAPLPLAHALATGKPQWFDKRARLVQMFPQLTDEELDGTRTQAGVAIPFIHGKQTIGGLTLSFETQRAFPDDERAWLESFATQCALAVERVRHYMAEHKARSEAENLLRIAESLNNMHLDLEGILQRVTDEATALVGAQFGAFFYNVDNDRGESYMLYTLSGARKEQFAKLGMPRNTAIFAHTFNGVGVVRLDDVKQDPRYGQMAPHHGMPAGHLPVTSYLAVPVKSRTGKVIGGLFFGHEEAARFTAQHESTLRALAITAAVAIDNAELYRAARLAEDAQRKSVSQLVETVRMNDLFTGVLAHDLRSPLAAITTASELLMMKANDAEKRVAARVLTSANRMARMIEQILDFTRIRVGTGLPLDAKRCDLQTILPHVIDELRIAHPNQSIAFDARGDTLGQWDEDRLGQVFSNLIGNAAQHGRPEVGIVVFVDGSDPQAVQISFQNGGTIPPDLLPGVFEPMIGGQRRKDGTRGLGLGLYITREIAAAHGGSVVVKSTPEEGTTFLVTLPRHVESREAAPREPKARATTTESTPLTPRRADPRQMTTLVEGVRDAALFLLDPSGLVQTWTDAARDIIGWEHEAVLAKPIVELYAPGERNVIEVELGRTAKLGFSAHEGCYVRANGEQFWAHVSLSALRSTDDKLTGYVVLLRDLTEERAAQQKLRASDARMRLMIDSVRDYAIFMLDANGNVASWNRGAQLAKGYTPGEIIGRNIEVFYTRDEREAGRARMLLQLAVQEGRVEDEGWRVRKDGSRFWADVVITALRDDDGVLQGFTKVTRDLTERRRAEEELRRSEERFRLLVDSVKDYAIFMLDPTGHIVTWNRGAERNKGYRASEIVGEHFSKFYPPEEVRAGKCDRELEIAIREGRFEEEGWRVRKDGSRFWANVVITPLRDARAELLGFAKVTRDLTERRDLEEERVRAIQAQEGIRLRDEFLSIVSHELKTPLAGLLLQIESAAHRASVDDKTRGRLERARESGERLDRLIETLLDVSRIATGRLLLNRERIDVAPLLRDTLDSFRLAANKVGSALQLTGVRDLVGDWDRVRITQVIANLLSNALKYGAGKPIEVHLARDGEDAVITVRDHGPGVDPTMQSKIFDRFERAAPTRNFGGLGLGLFVVREIVTAHGGTVNVENSPEGGARFTIRLPMESRE